MAHDQLLFRVLPKAKRQPIDNFGASDCWTIDPLIKWSEASRNRIADLLFSQDKGIGLSCWRFNLGGGINHETISDPLRTIECFETEPGVYDWNAMAGKVWMLRAAKERGVKDLLAFCNTPPRSLTRNGFTNCTEGPDTTNLKPAAEPAFAKYMCDIVEHFAEEGVQLTHLSPINEPDIGWNGVPEKCWQEGNRASNKDILAICEALADEMRKRNLDLSIVTPEDNATMSISKPMQWLIDLTGEFYGCHAQMFADSREWCEKVRPIYAYHCYDGDNLETMVELRKEARQSLDAIGDVPIWQTEYCQIGGPRGEGGIPRDLSMNTALNIARLIYLDLTIVEARAWQWWLGLTNGDFKDGLLYVDSYEDSEETVYASKLFWTFGNFSRFVRPGMSRIEVDGPDTGLEGVQVVAFADSNTGRVVVVAINHQRFAAHLHLDINGESSGYSAKCYTTSDRPDDDLRESALTSFDGEVILPSKSVVTYVLDPT